MTNIDGHGMGFTELNEAIRRSDGVCRITGLLGQRFLCAGMSDRSITLEGIPGNALGAYLGGGSLTVNGNAQDAVGVCGLDACGVDAGDIKASGVGAIGTLAAEVIALLVLVFIVGMTFSGDSQPVVGDVNVDVLLLEAGQVSLENEVVTVLLNVGLELAKGVVGEECAFQFVKVVERIEIGNIVIFACIRY